MDLMERLKRKDENALPDLMDAYMPLVRYLIRPILRNDQDVQECMNDIFLKVWDHIDDYDEEKGSFNSWLSVIARSTAVSRIRKKTVPIIPLEEALAVGNDDSIRERISELEEAVGTLKRSDRELFWRRYYLDQELKEIACETGLSVKGVEGRLYRLRRKLRKKVLEDE